jgi:hypothetical protein
MDLAIVEPSQGRRGVHDARNAADDEATQGDDVNA